MSYTKLNPQPTGLKAGETALELDNGALVAVSVVPTWLANGAGVSFAAIARCIDAEGGTQCCPQGQVVQTGFTHAAEASQAASAAQIGIIAKELLLALLGEPPTMQTIDGEDVPLLPLSDELRANINIRQQAAVAAATGPDAIDPAAVLGL